MTNPIPAVAVVAHPDSNVPCQDMDARATRPLPALIVIDDFTPDFDAVRARIIRGEFKTETGPDGASYENIQITTLPELHRLIERNVGFRIEPLMSFARYDFAGKFPHSYVHSDGICADYASVLYLNTPGHCRGGTAFWTHRFLGLDHMPTNADIQSHCWVPEQFMEQMQRDWKQPEMWRMTGLVGMKSNRFLAYPTDRFHSRNPHEGFGTSREDGRLIWVCFFNQR